MRKLGLIIFIILATILIAGCANKATVTGTVTYRERLALPPQGVVVSIKVEDVSRADAPAVTIGEQIIENPGHQVPIPFEIEYNPDDIDERYIYAMRVRIEVDGELWFINTTRHQVITHGYPISNVEVMLEKVGPRETVTLEDTTWVLESYGETGNLKVVIADTEITAEFISAEETVKGSAGCNSYFGSYELEGSQLSKPGPIGATEMYCMEPQGVMDQEQDYLAVLQLAESYEIDGAELQINCGSQVLIFKSD